jgi:hypothetical protein
MGLFDKLKFNLWNSSGAVVALLEKWHPRNCKSEKDFELSLQTFLDGQLEGVPIVRQYAIGRVKADLMIGKRVIVEMKHNLDSTGKYQRLVGQLTEYEKWDGFVIVILTGESDKELIKELKSFLNKLNQSGLQTVISTDRFIVFEK